jgi:glycosyltransferase involved in cell wall biosynthesis
MSAHHLPRTLVVNFNAPELNQLALALAHAGRLERYVRPYVNKGRWWERTLAAAPLAGRLYGATFGRRLMEDRELARLTSESGVLADVLAATTMRLRVLPDALRRRWTNSLIKSLREAVAHSAVRCAGDADCVVAYEGFALPAFLAHRAAGTGKTVLNYPVAHHRARRRERLEELEREPLFASTWPDFDDWPAGHEERLDEEIRMADAVLVGSTYASDSFVAEGIPRSRMKVIPYGVDLGTFTPPTDDERARRDARSFKVVYAGQLTQRKGLSYLLEGYRQFARADSQLLLVGSAVGDPRALAPYSHLFRHLPHQTRPDLARSYRSSDVFLFPTLVEGMPLVVLEAMACGLPVIVTANGPADIVRDGIDGFVVPARDPQAIARRLDELHRHPDQRAEMGRNASRRAAEFGWEAYTGKVTTYLSELCRTAVRDDASSTAPPAPGAAAGPLTPQGAWPGP